MRSRKAENSISAGHLSGSESLPFNENTWTQTTSIQKQMFTLPKSWIACGHALKTSFNTLSQHVGNYILRCLAIVTPPLSPTCPQPVSWNLSRKSKNNREISAWLIFFSHIDLEAPCNADCACSLSVYAPVCDGNGTTYFSACHAGCKLVTHRVHVQTCLNKKES